MKRGRKGEYEKWLSADGLSLISGWARQGLIDIDIAKNMGISKTTFYELKRKYTDFSEALKEGKEIADITVENALYKRAIGYKHEIVKPFMYKGDVIIAEFIEEVQPDVTAQIIWLKNRQPARWREKPDNDPNLAIELITKLVDSNMEMAKSVHTKASGSNAECK